MREFISAAAVEPGTAAVYSDWDHVGADGSYHGPRFTPELSRELLARTPYWGDCFLVQADAFRAALRQGFSSNHQLALRLTETGEQIQRVPRMLCHLQDAPAEIEVTDANPPAAAESVSIVICSRNPLLLERCLAALKPTLDSRHEVIVVAH